jgi:hypothetical protein
MYTQFHPRSPNPPKNRQRVATRCRRCWRSCSPLLTSFSQTPPPHSTFVENKSQTPIRPRGHRAVEGLFLVLSASNPVVSCLASGSRFYQSLRCQLPSGFAHEHTTNHAGIIAQTISNVKRNLLQLTEWAPKTISAWLALVEILKIAGIAKIEKREYRSLTRAPLRFFPR